MYTAAPDITINSLFLVNAIALSLRSQVVQAL